MDYRLLYTFLLRSPSAASLLPCFNSIAILTCNDLYPRCIHHLIVLHFEAWVFNYKRPYVVAKPVRMQMTLSKKELGTAYGGFRAQRAYLESGLRLHLFDHRIRQRFIKLSIPSMSSSSGMKTEKNMPAVKLS
jgi:hypothetical protein